MYLLYDIALLFLIPMAVMLSLLNRRLRKNLDHLWWRLGFGSLKAYRSLPSGPKVWFHAASVGEVACLPKLVAGVKEIMPDSCILASVMTVTGWQAAEASLKQAERIFYLPYDLPWAARRLSRAIRPRLFITVETEIWANFLRQAKRQGATVLMLNGRISPRSFGAYLRLRGFFRRVLRHYDRCAMIGPEDAERLVEMGAESAKVSVCGNVKFDGLAERVQPEAAARMRETLGLPEGQLILVAGSTRPGEEELILRVYRTLLPNHADLRLLIAPRHIERAPEVVRLVAAHGFEPVLRSRLGNSPPGETQRQVIVLDTMGELFSVYGLATLAFCGASLVPLGGQNPLEPAVWGKVALYGPSMEDFLEAKHLLETAGAGFTVADETDLAELAGLLLSDLTTLAKRGEAGRQAILAHRGAAERSLALIREMIF